MKRILEQLFAAVMAVLVLSAPAFAEDAEDTDAPDVVLPEVEPGSQFDPQWNQVPPGAPKQVTVKEGDTLWDICATYLGNPWFWPKVWKLNPQIANPHWIYPGNVIKLLPDDMSEGRGEATYENAANEGEVDMGELEEGEAGGEDSESLSDLIMSEDIEEDSGEVFQLGKTKKQLYDEIRAKQRNYIDMRRDGFVSASEFKASGQIVNAPLEMKYLSANDEVFVGMQGKQTALGNTYQIYRIAGEVHHPKTGDLVGYKVHILGQLKITKLGKPVNTGVITKSYAEIVRGDLLRPWRNPYRKVMRRPNKKNLSGYVIDSFGNNKYLAEWALVYLDKGINDGIEEGNHLTVMKQGDALDLSEFDSPIDSDKLPSIPIAELIVISAGSKTSVAVVWRSKMEITVGDKFVMKKD